MEFWIFFFTTALHSLVYIFFLLAPFRKRLRFPPRALAGIVFGYTLFSVFIFWAGGDFYSTRPGLFPGWMVLTLVSCFTVIDASPLELLFSIFVILDIQALVTAFTKVVRRVFILPRFHFPHDAELLSVGVLLLVFVPFMWVLFIGLFRRVVEAEIDFSSWQLLAIVPILHYIFDMATGFGGIGRFGGFQLRDLAALLLNMAVIFSTYLVSLQMLLQVNESHTLEKRAALMERQIEMQKNEYSRLTESIKADARLRHDWRHQLYLLSGYAEEGDLAAIQRYLQAYIGGEARRGDTVYCEHPTVEMLLHHFIARAEKQDTIVRVRAQVPRQLPIPDSDLCIVFGNLLENAVDACAAQRTGPRAIEVEAHVRGKQFLVFIQNSFDSPLEKSNKGGIFRSTKHKGDGIGLPSVCSIVKSRGGTCRIEAEGGYFRVDILMNL